MRSLMVRICYRSYGDGSYARKSSTLLKAWNDKQANDNTLRKLVGFRSFADYKVGGYSNLTQEILSAVLNI
ncbi:hypothetical protein R1sor_016473 [Riccia sorocarpa]|uniref:Uncharacterized protein n=1 Tax=Riccia sorocarpa TaxID=122646 RepID=A0ABD3HIB5_9MARC